jgi:hypothetical protein
MLLLPCPECCDERTFEQPLDSIGECEDGHGLDCPEWMCVDCGYAMLLATYPEIERPSRVGILLSDRSAA